MPGLMIIKIGGSTLRTGRLAQTLNLILKRQRPVIIVPGGGPFADFIRDAQREFGFSDTAAHHMALQAMHQFAYLISEFSQEFILCEFVKEFTDALMKDKIPIWLPLRMVETASDIAKNWSITSDSLTAWLAVQFGGAEVCLLKSCPVPEHQSLGELSDKGIIDTQFSCIVNQHVLKWSVVEINNDKQILKRICIHA